MSLTPPVLHMLCGKMAAGKSTLAAKLAAEPGTVLISEDAWLHALFADELTTGADYLRCATRLQAIMGPHVAHLLKAGVAVVLDFPANTVSSRVWLRDILQNTGAAHQMHVLIPPDDVCLARLRARNAQGDHPFAPTEAMFHAFSRHFVPPTPDEGFSVVIHDQES